MISIKTKDNKIVKLSSDIADEVGIKNDTTSIFPSTVWNKITEFLKYQMGLTKKSKDKLQNLSFLDTPKSPLYKWFDKYFQLKLEDLCLLLKSTEELKLKLLNTLCCKALITHCNKF